MSKTKDKKITLNLVGLNGNAFSLLGAFRKQARKEGWDKADIDAVTTEATSGDYDHLVAVLDSYCQGGGLDDTR